MVWTRSDRVCQGIFHCKSAKREGVVWPSERHGGGWWLQMSDLSKEEPGFDGSEGIGKRQEVCGQRRSGGLDWRWWSNLTMRAHRSV